MSGQPGAELGHAARLRCAAEDVEEEATDWASQWRRSGSKTQREDRKHFIGKEKENMGKLTFAS